MLLVQEFLKTKTFGDLEREHAVFATFDSRNGHKFSLNYDQIASSESDQLAQQCRGLILTTGASLKPRAKLVDGKLDYSGICPGETTVLAHPMHRFFNYGQGSAAPIDWRDSGLCTFEKLDGTLCIVYYDTVLAEWHVATRAVPEGDVSLAFPQYTFRTLFEKALQRTMGWSFNDLTANLSREYPLISTFCFEVTSPYNRIVVKYNDCRIHLLAARDCYGLEFPAEAIADTLGLPSPKKHSLGTIESVVEFVNSQSPMDHEGLVIRDSHFRRIKVKNASYVAYNKARDSLASSPRACLEIVLNEKDDDVIPYMPEEIVETLRQLKAKTASFLIDFDVNFKKLHEMVDARRANDPLVADWNDRKLYAVCVQESGIWQAPCFAMFQGKCGSLRDYIASRRVNGQFSNSFLEEFLKLINFSF